MLEFEKVKKIFFDLYFDIFIAVEDLEMNDGTPEKPYYMSKGLMKIIGKKNKQLKEPGKK